jgi:multidrug efflux pump subunit AcrA (membrane-fusion protein)
MRGKWLLISVLAVCAGIGGGALSLRYRRPAPAPPPHAGAAAAVISTTDVTLSGTIRPQHVTGVGSSVDGNIEAFMVEVGQEVFQGQVLARIGAGGLESEREAAAHAAESAQDQVSKAEAAVTTARLEASRAEADSLRARMALDRAQKVYARQQTLHAAGATPRLTYEKAQAEFEAALHESEIKDAAAKAGNDTIQAMVQGLATSKKMLAAKSQELEDAQGALEAAEVRAPVDGLVVGRKGEVGKPAREAGEAMFEIATDVFALEVSIDPPAAVWKRLQPRQPALVIVPDLQTGGMPAEVKEIKEDGQVVVEFNSTVPAVKPGMRADVRLKLE